jgi:hypothetical protein
MPASRRNSEKNMRKGSIGLAVAGLLLLWASALTQVQVVITQDCSVQILSVSLNRSTLSIGETLQVNVSYSLLYDTQDPLAIGVVAVSISAAGEEQPILTREYVERGTSVRKTASVEILPARWEPNETGQMGFVRVSGWVQDSYGSMTDYAERDFRIERSEVQLTLGDLPSQLVFHDQFVLTARITNAHNSSIVLDNHPVRIETGNAQRIMQTWDLYTLTDGTVAQTIQTVDLGAGAFMCNITSKPDGDYLNASAQVSFDIAKPSILLVARLNATAYLAYYPGMSNCTGLLTADLTCSSQIHDVSGANVTWTLAEKEGVLQYQGAQKFRGQVPMPRMAGHYTISIHASLPNHNSTDASLPVVVESREPILSLAANRTQAAYGDFIGLHVRVVDKRCFKPVAEKQVSIYVSVQADWILLVCATLDNNGELMITWQAQDVGNQQQFSFRTVFQGTPEFNQGETSIHVENTRNVRFFSASRVAAVRGKPASCTIQITTLESAPIPDLRVELVEIATNQTWCSVTTDSSGYASLGWNTPSTYELGEHGFLIVAANAAGTLGCITVLLVAYDGTVLTLV